MIKRSLYYWGRLYTSQLQKGMPYSSLHKTITINLLNFVMFPENLMESTATKEVK
jgi:predicted transposase/invertase (TIGR01784 family)